MRQVIFFSIVFLTAFLTIGILTRSKTTVPPAQITQITKKPLLLRGSIPYWDQQNAYESFSRNPSIFGELALFWYFLDQNGNIKKYTDAIEDTAIIVSAHAAGVKVCAVITNLPEDPGTTWDSKRVEKALGSTDGRTGLITEILQKLNALSFDGVSIDFESLTSDVKNNYTEFIKELSVALHKQNKFVGIALHPQTGKGDARYAFQNWRELGGWADELYIMAYDEHDNEGSPGPIASVPWISDIIAYARASRAPINKFFLGIPLYGYDWNKDNNSAADGLSYNQTTSLLSTYAISPKWDENAHAPYFSYERGGQRHEVWFENNRSIIDKIRLAQEAGLGGVTFWRLGDEDPALWNQIKTSIR
jgi:spore germination protein YaaH